MITKTKLTVEIELERDDEDEFPPFPTVSSVKIDGKEVEQQISTLDGCASKYWFVIGDQEGYMLTLEESLF